MNIKNQEEIYLDANFLVYWAQPKTPEIKKRVRFLLAQILKKKIVTSPLTVDEAWWGIKDTYNKIYNTQLGCADDLILPKIKKFTEIILERTNILQFINPVVGINKALDNVEQFRLKPRDAFHLAVMKDNDIDIIVTDDKDFIDNQKSMGISIQSIL